MDKSELGHILQPASVQYSDFVGTLALDDADHNDHSSLQVLLARIDPDLGETHLVVGLDIHSYKRGTSRQGPPGHTAWGTLYICDRTQLSDGDSIDQLVDEDGVLDVVALGIPYEFQSEIGEFLVSAFKRIHLRASRRDPGGGPRRLRPVDLIAGDHLEEE